MVACQTDQAVNGMRVIDAPINWWVNCAGQGLCGFSYVYPQSSSDGG